MKNYKPKRYRESFLGKLNRRTAYRTRLSWFLSRILWYALLPFLLLWRLVSWPVSIAVWLVASWWHSTRFWYLLKGLPALILVFGVALVVIGVRSNDVVASQYLTAARKAFDAERLEEAELLYGRAVELEGERGELLFELAMVAGKKGDMQRFQVLIDRLAPLGSQGYPAAQVYKAKTLLQRGNDIEVLAQVEAHLLHAIRGPTTRYEAHGMLGRLYLQLFQADDAVKHLRIAAEHRPQHLLDLARAYSLLDERASAKRYGEMAVEYCRAESELDPLNTQKRLNWAEAVNFLQDFPRAVRILEKGIAMNPEVQRLRVGLGKVYITWFDNIQKQPPVDEELQFQLIAKGIQANPREMEFLQRVLRVMASGNRKEARLRKLLNGLIANREASSLAHLILGTQAIKHHDMVLAARHLDLSTRDDPTMIIAANNLAWVLAHQDPPDLEGAFELIDVLADKWPDYAHFRDTRGQILVKLGRHEEALEDLRAALPQLQTYRPLHEALARVYGELGMDDLAAEHRERSRQINTKE